MKKPLTRCVNGDGRPVQPPSWVLCDHCLLKLSEKMYSMRDVFSRPANPPERGETPTEERK